MNRYNKYLILIKLFFISILINVIIIEYPFYTSTQKSLLEMYPTIYWVLLFLISFINIYLIIRIKSTYYRIFGAILFFFLIYSYNFFYLMLPEQTDVSSISFFSNVLNNSVYLTVDKIYYYEYPYFFIFISEMMIFFNIDSLLLLKVGFFTILLTFPILFSLMFVKERNLTNVIIFIFPVLYIIITFFFINSQLIPQFLGLFYAFLLSGTYIQLIRTRDVKYFYLNLLFFIMCIYSHPFMFIFFLLGVISERIIYLLIKIFRKEKEYFSNIFNEYSYKNFLEKVKGKKPIRNVSIVLFILLYIHGLYTRFHRIRYQLRMIFFPTDEKGETWYLLFDLFGKNNSVEAVGYRVYPLYNLIHKSDYLIVRNINIIILLIVISILIIITFKYKKKDFLIFDIGYTIGSIFFLIIGFFIPNILGQRAVQVIFLKPLRYFKILNNMRNIFKYLIFIIIIISPITFTLNIGINSTLDGYRYIEDIGTINGGKFIMDYTFENSIILRPDRSYYPVNYEEDLPMTYFIRYNTTSPRYLMNPEYNEENIDIIIGSQRLQNRFQYHGLNYDEFIYGKSKVYDVGSTVLFV